MDVFSFFRRLMIRLGFLFTLAALLVGFAFILDDLSTYFWHTTYWFVAIFLVFILLSNLIAKLVSVYLDT
jgi:hypothetical protein